MRQNFGGVREPGIYELAWVRATDQLAGGTKLKREWGGTIVQAGAKEREPARWTRMYVAWHASRQWASRWVTVATWGWELGRCF